MSPRHFVFGAVAAAGIALAAAVVLRPPGDPGSGNGSGGRTIFPAAPGAVNSSGATRFIIAAPWEQTLTTAVETHWTVSDREDVLPASLKVDYEESYTQVFETVEAGRVTHCRREYGTRRLRLPPLKPGEDFREPFDLAGVTVFFDQHTKGLEPSTAEGDQDPALLAALCTEPPSQAFVPAGPDVATGEQWPLRPAPLLGFLPGTGISLSLEGDCAAGEVTYSDNRRWMPIRLTVKGTLKSDGKEWTLRGTGEAKADLEQGRVVSVTLSGEIEGPGIRGAKPTWILTVGITFGGGTRH